MTRLNPLNTVMTMRSIIAANTIAIAGLALALWSSAHGVGHAQGPAPFEKLAGQWSGNGTIDLTSGAKEPIRCRASYDVLEQQSSLQLNIRCASETYNFDLRASAKNAAGAISGTWSESSRNVAGTISGKAGGNRFEILAKGPSFSAQLTLITQDNRQSVIIQSREEKTAVKRASISLQRGS
ncbi:MAG: hypothetical protein HY244_14980 [Rhizobiales bacterium]|nr:hypothetical protein [Hyphomicrobiales bacterium]